MIFILVKYKFKVGFCLLNKFIKLNKNYSEIIKPEATKRETAVAVITNVFLFSFFSFILLFFIIFRTFMLLLNSILFLDFK